MNAYLINTILGFVVVMGENEQEAYVKFLFKQTRLGDMCLDREDLIKRGYTKIEGTSKENIFLLIK